MKPRLIALLIAAPAALGALAAPARADISVIDNDKTLDVDCAKDPQVSLVGNHITVSLKGVCTKIAITGNNETVTGSATTVYVAGNNNTLTLDAADDVTVVGNNNTLAVQKAIKRKAPKVANSGTDNKISKPK